MVGRVISLRPSEILFTQNSVADHFGEDIGSKSIEDTFTDLLYGDINAQDIRCIAIVSYEGRYWVVSGNRRLYIYRKLEACGRITSVTAKLVPINMERFNKMKTTNNYGADIAVRQSRVNYRKGSMTSRLDNIYRQWDHEGRPTNGRRASHPAGDLYTNNNESYDIGVSSMRSSSSSYSQSTSPTPSYSYKSPAAVPAPQPRNHHYHYQPPPQPKKDDSWCTIL